MTDFSNTGPLSRSHSCAVTQSADWQTVGAALLRFSAEMKTQGFTFSPDLLLRWDQACRRQPQVAPQKLILRVRRFVCFFPNKTGFNAALPGLMIKEGGGAEWMLEKMGVSERVYHRGY